MKKINKILSILMMLGLVMIPNAVSAEEKSSYFNEISCQIGSREDFSCSITTKDNFTPSSNSKVYLYMVPNGEDVSTVIPFEFDSSIIETNGNTINIIADGCFFKYGYAEASFDFVIELVNADGNGEKIYYTANTSTLTKIEKIGATDNEVENPTEDKTEDTNDKTETPKEDVTEDKTETPKEDETVNTPVQDKTEAMAEDKKIASSVLAQIKTDGNKVTLENKVEDKVTYSWTFDGSKMDTTDFNIDLSLTIGKSTNQTTIESLVANKDNSLLLEFGYHGNLPKGTSIKVLVADKYKDGDKLTLYYFNEETKKLEETVKDIEVKNGYVEFALEHCSEYVLHKNSNSNNAQTSSPSMILYGVLAVSSLCGIIIISRKKMA